MTEDVLALEKEAVETKVSALYYGRFLRRLAALAVDAMLLSVIGLLAVIIFKDQLTDVGRDGWVIGYAICAAYFAFSQGQPFDGQSLGMYLFELRVIGKDGNPVSIFASLVRFIILSFPFFIHFITDPVIYSYPPPWFQMVGGMFFFIMAGLPIGSGILVMLHPERRAFHDFIAGTWVTEPGVIIDAKLTEKEAEAIRKIPKGTPKPAWITVVFFEALLLLFVLSFLSIDIFFQKSNSAYYYKIYNLNNSLSTCAGVKDPSLIFLIDREKDKDNITVLKQDIILRACVDKVTFNDEAALSLIRTNVLKILDRELPGNDFQNKIRLSLENGFDLGIGHYWRTDQMDYVWKDGRWTEERSDE